MDIATTCFVFGFVFSSLLLLVIGFRDIVGDVSVWLANRDHGRRSEAADTSTIRWIRDGANAARQAR